MWIDNVTGSFFFVCPDRKIKALQRGKGKDN